MTFHFNVIDDANLIGAQRLARNYLSPTGRVWTVEEACITGRPTWNRCGVPADATTVRYLVEHPTQGWSFAFRAVWRGGALWKPATLIAIEDIYDDGGHGDAVAARYVNEWLCSL